MPDFSREKIKYNPPTASPGYDVNKGDYTDSLIAGSPRGVFRWRTVGDLSEAIKILIQSWVEGLIDAHRPHPAAINHLFATCRIDSSDPPGMYAMSQSSPKAPSGAAAPAPIVLFTWLPALVSSGVQVKMGVYYAANDVGYHGALSVGWFPVDLSGSGAPVYSLGPADPTTAVFSHISDIPAGQVSGSVTDDIRDQLDLKGIESYAFGIDLGISPAAGGAIDIGLAMQLTPF